MRRLLLSFPLLLVLTAAAPQITPRRIVSLNLCADQYLLALADRTQIVAVTQFAADPQMSAAAAQARGLRATRGSAEDVLALRPDLVLASPWQDQLVIAHLAARGVPVVALEPAADRAAIVGQVEQVARAVGHPARGTALIAAMDRALARVPGDAEGGKTAAYYQRRGFLTGTGTLVDDLMRRVGLRNLAARLGKPALARVGLEELALSRPDYLIVETDAETVADQGTEMLHHPLLKDIPRLRLPQAWTVCGGPAYVKAAVSLSVQLRAAR